MNKLVDGTLEAGLAPVIFREGEGDGKKLVIQVPEIGISGVDVEESTEPDLARERVKNTERFIEDLSDEAFHKDQKQSGFRQFISVAPSSFLIVFGIGVAISGLIFIAAAAMVTGATFGGGIPIGAILGGLGLGLCVAGIGAVALGITKIAREATFKRKVNKFDKEISESTFDQKQQQQIKAALDDLKKNYSHRTLNDSKMRLLKMQIKYLEMQIKNDKTLSKDEKIKLLKDYENEEITKNSIAALRKNYKIALENVKKH